MDELAAVTAFEQVGREGGPLAPVYELAARRISRLAPPGARVVDLGCGPARHLSYLARRRPDITVTALDIAPNMLKLARETIAQEGVADQIELVEGDMTDFAGRFDDEPVDIVTSIFALHHLPTLGHLDACLGEIRTLRQRTGCGIVIFDLARLRHPASWRRFLSGSVAELLSAPELERDSIASEAAAWSWTELRVMLERSGLAAGLSSRRSFPLGGFQLHWAPPTAADWREGDVNWTPQPMPLGARVDLVPLKLMFRQF